jgi:hypothetical protein
MLARNISYAFKGSNMQRLHSVIAAHISSRRFCDGKIQADRALA